MLHLSYVVAWFFFFTFPTKSESFILKFQLEFSAAQVNALLHCLAFLANECVWKQFVMPDLK
jgi:hypothetical protein